MSLALSDPEAKNVDIQRIKAAEHLALDILPNTHSSWFEEHYEMFLKLMDSLIRAIEKAFIALTSLNITRTQPAERRAGLREFLGLSTGSVSCAMVRAKPSENRSS